MQKSWYKFLYTFSFLLLMVATIQLLKFIWPHLQTRYIELPAIIIYSAITNATFFNRHRKWVLVLKSILATTLCFILAEITQDFLINILA